MIETEYQLNKSELRALLIRRKLFQKNLLLNIIILLLLGLVGVWLNTWIKYLAWAAIICAFLLPIFFALAINNVINSVRNFTVFTQLHIAESGIILTDTDAKRDFGWSSFSGWSETREHFILEFGIKNNGLILPKRAFNKDQSIEFTRYLQKINRT